MVTGYGGFLLYLCCMFGVEFTNATGGRSDYCLPRHCDTVKGCIICSFTPATSSKAASAHILWVLSPTTTGNDVGQLAQEARTGHGPKYWIKVASSAFDACNSAVCLMRAHGLGGRRARVWYNRNQLARVGLHTFSMLRCACKPWDIQHFRV